MGTLVGKETAWCTYRYHATRVNTMLLWLGRSCYTRYYLVYNCIIIIVVIIQFMPQHTHSLTAHFNRGVGGDGYKSIGWVEPDLATGPIPIDLDRTGLLLQRVSNFQERYIHNSLNLDFVIMMARYLSTHDHHHKKKHRSNTMNTMITAEEQNFLSRLSLTEWW